MKAGNQNAFPVFGVLYFSLPECEPVQAWNNLDYDGILKIVKLSDHPKNG